MGNDLKELLNKYNIKVNKLIIKNNVKIIFSNNKYYVIKKNNNNIINIYNYLFTRGFDYLPSILYSNNNYIIYEYIEDSSEPFEQKIFDLLDIVILLHKKTTYYKQIDYDDYKYLYESLNNKLDYLYNYYNDIINLIEESIYMSPSNYLIASNINLIYQSLYYCKSNLEKWYNLVKDKHKIRVVTLHNNLCIDHYLKKDRPYLISWDNSTTGIPIYDLLNLYRKYNLLIDFYDLINHYESKYILLEEERILLFILISIPDKIILSNNEYENTIKCQKFLDNIHITKNFINKYYTKNTNQND